MPYETTGTLLVINAAPVFLEDDRYVIDTKFFDGICAYVQRWQGPVRCLVPLTNRPLPFSQPHDRRSLPFEINFHPHHGLIGAEHLRGAQVVLASGDCAEYLHLAKLARKLGIPLVYVIENIPETRQQIIWLDRESSWPRKLHSALWARQQEGRRRRAFEQAAGLQANGYPAHETYRSLNSQCLLYIDGRMRRQMMASPQDTAARKAHLQNGGTLRLVHSGRLEPLKGSDDLLVLVKRLLRLGVNFSLDIFGTGSLEGLLREGFAALGVTDRVRIHAPVDFETELVPWVRARADIYVSCHRQSDPSCTYLENMGCGTAVIGYDNRMWTAMAQHSKAGWVVPQGKPEAMATCLATLDRDRNQIILACEAALSFAQMYDFENVSQARINQLHDVAKSAAAATQRGTR